MLTFSFGDFGVRAEAFGRVEKQARFVAAYALTNAMKDAREAEIDTMRSVFDKPTPYTLRALKVVPATKANLRAELGFKEFGGTPAWKYLGPQVEGGPRRRKRFEIALQAVGILRSNEYVVPGAGATLDGYGNMSSGQLRQLLSALGASSDRAQNTQHRPKRGNRRRNLDFFVLRGTRAPDGVYLRVERKAVPMLIFVRSVSYRPRFPYYSKAREVIPRAYERHFRAGWTRFAAPELARAA